MKKIIINPVTRISGFMEIDVTVENKKITDAKTKGLQFRGFEQMLKGRNPFDAVYFTQRICGICSTAHSMSSSMALESALRINIDDQGKFLRDIIHGSEFLQNHIRHFYQYTIPDYVKLPNIHPLNLEEYHDYRLPDKFNRELSEHYFESLTFSRLAHKMLSILGGKAPHNHGVFIGGVTTIATVDKIIEIKSILKEIIQFIETKMIPDVYILAEYYSDYFNIGKGYGNLLTFGCFNNYNSLKTLYVEPLVFTDGRITKFNKVNITETINHSWYDDKLNTYKPLETIPKPSMDKKQSYTWVKAPRYLKRPYEVGPLARQFLAGEYTRGISTMDRTIARVLEAKKIADIIATLIDNVIPNEQVQREYGLPETAIGDGLIDTTRGALGHWLKIKNEKIAFYQIITPSGWNFSTKDDRYYGTAEAALLGMEILDYKNPVEIGRVLRSFDPCMSCATHVYNPDFVKSIQIL